MHRGRSFLLVACAGTVCAIAIACGSKTGLLLDDTIYQDGESPTEAGKLPPFPDSGPKPLTCTPGTFTLTPAATDMMFVIDRSGSMSQTLDGSTPSVLHPSKWSLLQAAITPVLDNIQSTIEVGAKFFPQPLDPTNQNLTVDQSCGLGPAADVDPALSTADAILNLFVSTQPVGGTPTAAAIQSAASYLSDPNSRSVAKYMVLATDGAPNCNGDLKVDPKTCVCTAIDPQGGDPCAEDPQDGIFSCLDDNNTVQAISDAVTNNKIPTYVIGLGTGDQTFIDVLNRMAVAGQRARPGSPQYYDVQSQADLTNAFTAIQASISKCTFVTPSAPTDPNAITILIDGKAIPRDTSHLEGWDWIDEQFGEIALFGGACNPEGGAQGSITATVACDTD